MGDKVKRAGGLLVFLKLFVNVKDGVAAVREMTVVMEEKGCKWELFNILIHFVQNGSSVYVCVYVGMGRAKLPFDGETGEKFSQFWL